MLLGLICVFFFVFRAQKVVRIYKVSFHFPTSARGETGETPQVSLITDTCICSDADINKIRC